MIFTDPDKPACTCSPRQVWMDGHTHLCPMTTTKTVTIPLEELENLKARNRGQAREIQILSKKLHQKNLDLDALTFVWCSGGCPGGVHRFSDTRLTEEMIQRAERNVQRMRSWYNTVKWRLTKFPTMSEWHKKYAQAAAARTDLPL